MTTAIVGYARPCLRSLLRSPGFTVAVVGAIGISVGMVSAVVTVYRVVIATPLPIADAANVVTVSGLLPPGSSPDRFPLRGSLYERYDAETGALESLAGVDYNAGYPRAFTDGEQSFLLRSGFVTGDLFEVLGAAPHIGRLLRPADDTPGAEPVMVIGHRFWQDRYAGDAEVVGRVLTLHDRSIDFRIVGVAAPGLEFPVDVDFWAPLSAVTYIPEADSTNALINPVGRLAPGRSFGDLANEFAAFVSSTPDLSAMSGGQPQVEVQPLIESVVGDIRPTVQALALGAVLLLLVAVVNVGVLFLLRIEAYSERIHIRRVLGAGPLQTVTHLVGEAVWLASLSLGTALITCLAFLEGLQRAASSEVARLASLADVGPPVATTSGLTALAFLLAAGLPLIRASTLGATARTSPTRVVGQTRAKRRVSDALIASEIALTIVILSSAGLLVRTVQELQRIDTGFQADGLTILELSWPWEEFAQEVIPFFSELLVAVDGVRGIEAATPTVGVPFGAGWDMRFVVEGQSEEEALANPWLNVELGGVDYFRTFDIAVQQGRGFQPGDGANDPRVAIVSETAANRLWPGQNPLGKRIGTRGRDSWATIVGVAEEARQRDLVAERATVYFPYLQSPAGSPLAFAIRTSLPSEQVVPLLRRTITETDPRVVVSRARVMETLMEAPLSRPRLAARLLASLALAALVLASLGVYSVLAASVRMRVREFGVRRALGATRHRISTLILRRGLTSCALGVTAGVGVSLFVGSTLRALLYQVQTTDPHALGGSAALITLAALIASLIPARAATRIQPVEALRSD